MATEPEMSPQAHLRHYLREWREFRNLRQEDLAKLVGVSESIISRYETGRRGISLQMQIRFMRVLGITPNQFFEPPDAPTLEDILTAASPADRKRLVTLLRAVIAKMESE
jgi:transcriptional regulator with XRE-family HTH domain